jgi:hypothetical protein
MPVLSHPAFGPRTALAYVTGGALLCVWTIVWYCTRDYTLTHSHWFWLAGLFFTGVTLIFLGLVLGPLGRVARQAELPPPDALQAEAAIQRVAAAHPPAVVLPASAPPAPVTTAPVTATPPAPVNPEMPVTPESQTQVAPAH